MEKLGDVTKRVVAAIRQAGDPDVDQISGETFEGAPPPVDRDARQLVNGQPVPADDSHTTPRPNGQQRDYVVLTDAERAKGFVRPVRLSYKHVLCGTTTTMAQKIAETYARDPGFYGGTFCVSCGGHFPLRDKDYPGGAFLWEDGSAVGG